MSDGDGKQPANALLTEEIRAWYRAIGRKGGLKGPSREQRSLTARLFSRIGWLRRRERHGPSGRRARPYTQWLKAHGKPLPSELGDSKLPVA